MSEIQIMTLLNPLHDITDDFPGFSFRKMRFILDISFLYEVCEVFLTKFHQNAIFVVLDIHLVPPVEDSDDIWRICHANCRNNFQLSPIHCPSSISHHLQCINLQPVSQNNPRRVTVWSLNWGLYRTCTSACVIPLSGKGGVDLPCKRLRKPLFRALPESQICSNDWPSSINDERNVCREVLTPFFIYPSPKNLREKRWRSIRRFGVFGGLGVDVVGPSASAGCSFVETQTLFWILTLF